MIHTCEWNTPMPVLATMALTGMVLTALVAFTNIPNQVLTPVRGVGLALFQTQLGLQIVFVVACLIHFSEAVWAVDVCVRSGEPLNAPAWFGSTMLFGYPSLGVLLKQQKAER